MLRGARRKVDTFYRLSDLDQRMMYDLGIDSSTCAASGTGAEVRHSCGWAGCVAGPRSDSAQIAPAA
jgi:hypothetical protein